MAYVDGFVVPVPRKKMGAYRRLARKAGRIFVYRSRADRDRILKKVMADKRLKTDPQAMPFDGKRMIYGGFKVMVDL